MLRRASIVVMVLCIVSLVTGAFGDKIKQKVPSPSVEDQLKSLVEPGPKVAKPAKPKEDQVDIKFTPSNAEIRIWKNAGWVTVHNQRIDPRLGHEGAGVPYDHAMMAQYFDWKNGEKPPEKKVIFVVIQQSHGWTALDGETGKPIAGMQCTHYYHFLVDPASAKVVKDDAGISQVFFGLPSQKKQKPPPDPEQRKV